MVEVDLQTIALYILGAVGIGQIGLQLRILSRVAVVETMVDIHADEITKLRGE